MADGYRPDSEALLQELRQTEGPPGGRLKIFFGYAAGVGKTYAMLEAAHRAKAAARDLAKGLIDLYARRQRLAGFAFSPDSPWQQEFEEAFPYAETDDQLRAIRDTGGVVGLNVHHAFVHADREKQTAEMLARHAAHMAEVMGVEHVACGFDFCQYFGPGNEGAEGLESAAHTGNLFYWLEKLGMNERERNMIARENFLRILS